MTPASFSRSWKASTQPRKQRKYGYAAPIHLRQRELQVHLFRDLRRKYGFRGLRVRTGDQVRVMRGQFSQKEGKVVEVDVKRTRIYVGGIEIIKKDGSKVPYPIHPSNLLLTELDLGDNRRKAKVNSKANPKVNSKQAKLKSEVNQ